MDKSFIDMLWVVVSAGLVFLMQAGFLCLETGMTRSKNNINVAIKNLADFGLSTVLFWAFGYAIMFGATSDGWVGRSDFLLDFSQERVWITVFFFFQVMFCGTTVTILSGAIAERVKFSGYLIIAGLVSSVIYPFFGHWAWNGADLGTAAGWLGSNGFVDFAGSTVVHSVGGWASLAILVVVGSRAGRFPKNGAPKQIPASNVPLATLGVFLLWFGWFGFNGGSTLTMNNQVAHVLASTVLAGGAGLVGALLVGWWMRGQADVNSVLNGSLAGLVAITANAHAVSAGSAVIIGAGGGIVMLATEKILEYFRIDDAVSAIPVHLGAGIWGTLAVALFGQPEYLGTGLGFWSQLQMQIVGIVVCFVWTFGSTYLFLMIIQRITPLRVTPKDEQIGLNVSEHGASTELLELFNAMEMQSKTGDLSVRVPVEPFTQIGQIAERYNKVMDALEETTARIKTIIRTARDGIIIFSKLNLIMTSPLNPAAQTIFGYHDSQMWGQPISLLLRPTETGTTGLTTNAESLEAVIANTAKTGSYREMMGRRADGSNFAVEVNVAEAVVGHETFYIGTFRDITERKQTEEELRKYREELETKIKERTVALVSTNEQLLQEIVERERAEQALRLTQFSVDNTAICVFWIGPQAEFIYVNKAACHLLGYTEEELLTMSLYHIDPNYPLEVWANHWQKTRQYPITVETRYHSKSGQTIPIEVTFTYLEFGEQAYNFAFARDISRRLWAVQALRESEERFRQVVSSISDQLYMTELTKDSRLLNRYISPNIETLTGYTPDTFLEVADFWWSTVVHPDDHQIVADQTDFFRNGQDSEVEYRIIRADGKEVWVRDSGRAHRDVATQSIIIYGVVSDITIRKETEQVLARARNEALAANRLKSRLLATVSHELRTPLNAIVGYTDMLVSGARGQLSEPQHHVLSRIEVNSSKLKNLISNLLDQAQLEKGKLQFHITSFRPSELIDGLEPLLAPQAEAKRLQFIIDIADDMPAMLLGDLDRLQDILINLASNALKFTETGSVQIKIFRPDQAHWAMQVIDTGPGIPAEAQPHIFRAFRQADGTITRGHGGSGLGLSIVKNLTRLMQGQVTVDSQVGRGSTFTVLLPLLEGLKETP